MHNYITPKQEDIAVSHNAVAAEEQSLHAVATTPRDP